MSEKFLSRRTKVSVTWIFLLISVWNKSENNGESKEFMVWRTDCKIFT